MTTALYLKLLTVAFALIAGLIAFIGHHALDRLDMHHDAIQLVHGRLATLEWRLSHVERAQTAPEQPYAPR